MSRVTMFAGLDYYQNAIQVCVQDHTGRVCLNRSCNNDPAEVTALLRQAGPVSEVSLEACCGSAAFGEAIAAMGSWRVNLAHACHGCGRRRTRRISAMRGCSVI
jgi:hypothetical protein